MSHEHPDVGPFASVLLALATLAGAPLAGLAQDDAQALRDMEDRARAQAEALRGQEEAIRRIEATQARIQANSEQLAQQTAEQARTYLYPYYPGGTLPPPPRPPPLDAAAPAMNPDVAPHDAVSAIRFAPLTERLKSYFGAASGVLVVNAGGAAPFGLQDGDVILSIDGRVPVDVDHAARILRSYLPGERLKLRVQRDRRAIDLDSTAPLQPVN